MKKHLTFFLVTLLAVVLGLGVFTACDSSKTPKAEAPVIAENTKTVELGASDDLVYGVDWKNGTLTEVRLGQIALTSANYESDEDSLTVKGDYVADLAEGTHTFTLVTDGGSAEFKIVVTDSRPAYPTVTADKPGSFNTLDPDDLITYTVDWDKGTFVNLKVGDTTLEKDTDYMVDGNKLSIVGKGLIDTWDADTYTFTLTTTTGSATFELTVVESGSRYLDEKVFKVAEGGDVSFAMLIGATTQISSVKTNGVALDATSYEYANETFSLKADYLAKLEAGIHEFTVELDDTTVYELSVATGTVMAENFENGTISNSQIWIEPNCSPVVTDSANAINGKSVDIDCITGFATTVMLLQNLPLKANTLYVVNMTVRLDGLTQVIFTCEDKNHVWINANGTISREPTQFIDSRSTSTLIDENDNLYQLKLYIPVTAATNMIHVLYRNHDSLDPTGGINTRLVIDDIYIVENTTETFMPASKADITPAYQEIPSLQDVNVTVNNNYGNFVSLTENNAALTENDYTVEGNTLTIKKEYLQARGMTVGDTLTFTYNTVNPDKESETFATTFSVKLNATVWGSVYEKEFDGTNDVSFDVTIGETSGVTVKLGAIELTASDFAVSATAVTVKASYLNTLESNKVYQFIMVDSSNNEFRFAIYVGCTAQTVLYENFEDGVLPSGESLGIEMKPSINDNGFDGKAATLSGKGTLLYINRPVTGADMNAPITLGETYELSMQFKFAESGKPVAGAGVGYGAFAGNANIVFAILDGKFSGGNYARIDVDGDGELSLVNVGAVADKTSLTKDDNGVYTLVVTFVAAGYADLQVTCWNACTFDVDNIMLRNVPGVPTTAVSAYTFDKSTSVNVTIPVTMHGSTFSEVRINDAALTSDDYSFDGGVLTLNATKLATYETDTVLSVTIVSNAGVSAAVSITIADAVPVLTNGDVYAYDPALSLNYLGLDTKGKTVNAVKIGDAEVSADAYTYDSDAKKLVFTDSYISSLVGVVEFTVTFVETERTITFTVDSPLIMSLNFEDGLPSGESLGIVMTRSINDNGFDGKAATLSGAGTLLYINRAAEGANITAPITLGNVYQLSMQFKFAENGAPVAGAGNDYTVLGGKPNVVFAFLDTTCFAKYAYIEVDTNGDLVLNKMYCVEDSTSLTKDGNGVYTLVLTFVAATTADLQVPCWNSCTLDVDNITMRKFITAPTLPSQETYIDIDFEDGVLSSDQNLGVSMPTRSINDNGFDGKAATLSGTGTLLYINRTFNGSYYSSVVYLNAPISVGKTYELSMQFKFAENGKPVAGAANDWGVLGGNKNVVFAFGNDTFGEKYAYIDVDANGELSLVNVGAIANESSLTKDANGVYTLVLTYVAAGDTGLQVPCWNSCTVDVDNIRFGTKTVIPTATGSYTFDKSADADVAIPVDMHGSTLSEVRINDAALTSDDYSFDGSVLTLNASKLITYNVGDVLSVTIVADTGVSAPIKVAVANYAPQLTDGDAYEYGPDDPLTSLGLETYGKTIKEVKTGDTVVPATAYTYDATAKTFTFTESYLMSLEGTVEFTITFEGSSAEIKFSVVSKILDTVFAMNFEDDNVIAPVGQIGTQLDGIKTLSQSVITDNGSKALKIESVPASLVTIYSTNFTVNLDPTYVYMFKIDITVKAQVPVLLRFSESDATSRDFFWIQADGSLVTWTNPQYDLVQTDLGNGYVRYEIESYSVPTRANLGGNNGNFEIATFAPDGSDAFDVILDNLQVSKTSYPILMIDFEDDDYKVNLGSGLAMFATTEVYTGENSISGNNSLHYSSTGNTNLLLLRPKNEYMATTLVGGVTYKLSFKIQISNFPADINQLQMPIRSSLGNGDIGYVRPDPNAAGEPYIELPWGVDYVAGKKVIDADKDIYELSVTWTNPETIPGIDFAIWGAVDSMVIDDICLEVVR